MRKRGQGKIKGGNTKEAVYVRGAFCSDRIYVTAIRTLGKNDDNKMLGQGHRLIFHHQYVLGGKTLYNQYQEKVPKKRAN